MKAGTVLRANAVGASAGLKGAALRGSARRERPADGGMPWREQLNAFFCEGCAEYEEIRRRADRTPAKLAELKELLIVEHTECWQFNDPEMARQQRRYRKRKTLRANLAAQRVGWRGAPR
jgi:hypothetical protein